MKTFEVDGGALEFRVRGRGSPLVLVHGSIVADPWEPMLRHADLLATHRVVTFRRRGYGGSSPPEPGRTIGNDGADVVALLDHLDIERAPRRRSLLGGGHCAPSRHRCAGPVFDHGLA